MTAVALDTLRIANDLKAAGMPSEHAEAVTRAIGQAREFDLDRLATKADLQPLESDIRVLKADVQTLKADGQALKADVQTLKSETQAIRGALREIELRMTVKLGSVAVVAVGIILAAIRYLPPAGP